METSTSSGQPLSRHQSATPIEGWLEQWWIALPARIRFYNVLLSEAWRDGIYLTRWPLASIVLPLLAFLAGGIEGATHWTISINQYYDPQSVALTELLPFMVFAAIVGSLSANAGILVTLGYALGDFFIAGPRVSFYFGSIGAIGQPLIPDDTLWNRIIFLHTPQLISYIVLFLLAVQPTLFTRYTVSNIRPLLEKVFSVHNALSKNPLLKKVPVAALVEALIGGLVQGGIVYIWTISTPVVIRVFWGWLNQAPPIEAAYFLQNFGIWIAIVAGGAVVIRGLVASWAFHSETVRQNWARQASEVAQVTQPAKRGFSRIMAVLFTAGGMTILLSGAIGTIQEGLLVFGLIGIILLVRNVILPLSSFWRRWAQYLANIPVIVRLAYGGYIAYQLTQLALSYYLPDALPLPSASASLLPVLISSGISLLMFTLFLPASQPTQPK